MARRFVPALVLLAVACVRDPAAGAVFACDPGWATKGLSDPCRAGCRCEAAPADRPYVGVCACGAAAFDFGPVVADVVDDAPEADAADADDVAADAVDVPDDAPSTADVPEDAPATSDVHDVQDVPDGEASECAPDCQGRECGPDGCDGSCGTCGSGLECSDGLCSPQCWNDDCPPGFVVGDACRCRVPSTGSHLCNNGSGLVACSLIPAGQDFFAQDGHFDGSPREYEDQGDGTVLDPDTGLVWAGTLAGEGIWSDAMQRCSDNIAGLQGSNWCLPSAFELIALTDHGTQCPTWNALFGTSCGAGPLLWSSTVRPNDLALVGDFEHGALSSASFGATIGFRCVRGGGKLPVPVGAGRFVGRSTGIVDRMTGLEWQHTPAATTGNWKTALATCLNLGSGWRLPTVNELTSLVLFFSTVCVTWPPIFGADCGATKVFWSSTPMTSLTESAYGVDFGSATVIGVSLFETSLATRCVRAADVVLRGGGR